MSVAVAPGSFGRVSADLRALLQYVRQNAPSLGIDEKRIGVWACSGNAPLALSLLMREGGEPVKCASGEIIRQTLEFLRRHLLA